MEFYVFGGIWGFTLICEENWFGGIGIWLVLGFWVGVPRGVVRRGDTCVFFESVVGSVHVGGEGFCRAYM
jgi:hypothetical protein